MFVGVLMVPCNSSTAITQTVLVLNQRATSAGAQHPWTGQATGQFASLLGL